MSTLNINKNQQGQLPPQWTVCIAEDVYHAKARSGAVISSTMLKQFRRCPAEYKALVTGKISLPDKPAYRIGRAVHKLLLEGESAYRGAFSVGGPINRRTGRSYTANSRTFGEWIRENGLDAGRIITSSEADDIANMQGAVRRHAEAAALLRSGWPERCALARYAGLDCQIRLDWLTPDGVAVDVKTTHDIVRFEKEAKRYDYLHQFAFYRDVALSAGAVKPAMAAVVIEKRAPFRVGVWRFPDAVLEPYAVRNREALQALAECVKTGVWPTGYEKPRIFPPAGVPAVWLN